MDSKAKKIKDAIDATLKRRGVKHASLFGSIARGESNEESDIDLLVEFEGRKSLLDLAGLKLELEEPLAEKLMSSLMTRSIRFLKKRYSPSKK